MTFSDSIIRSFYNFLNWFFYIDFILNWNLYNLFHRYFYDLLYRNLDYFFNRSFYDNLMDFLFFKISLNWNIYINIYWNIYIGIIRFWYLFYNFNYLFFFNFFKFLLSASLRHSWGLCSSYPFL